MKTHLVLLFLIMVANIAFAQRDTGQLSAAMQGMVITPGTRKAAQDTNKGKRLIICSVSRGRLMSAVTVIFVRDRLIYKSDTGRNSGKLFGSLNPKLITNISVLSGPQAAAKYGDIAKYGTIEVSVDPKKNRPAYRQLKKQIKEAKRAVSN